ncbi:hypothetical protein MRX96_042194 [Rhipicephalus microplus]
MVAEGFRVNNGKVTVEAVGPPITYVNVYRFPAYIPDEIVVNALAQYGKIFSAKGRETVPPGELAALEGHPSSAARVITVPGPAWFLRPAEAPKELLATYRTRQATSGSRRPPGVVSVYKPLLACHSRLGRQCLLAASTSPGPRDNIVVVIAWAYQLGHHSTGTWTPNDEVFQSGQREKTSPGSSKGRRLSLPAIPGPVTNAYW